MRVSVSLEEKKSECRGRSRSDFFVPGAGVEPAHLAILVFETNASTNSAIRAINSIPQVLALKPIS